jgi:hypothetical protein
MGIAFQLDERLYGDFTLDNLNSRQMSFVCGTFAYDSASSTALTVTGTGLRNIMGFTACNKGGMSFQFTPANNTIQPISVLSSVTGVCYTVATASGDFTTSVTSIPFMCWGFR